MEHGHSICRLPLYSPSYPSPCYSEDPAGGETTLACSPRVGTGLLPTGIFTKSCGSATVVLFNQEQGADAPSYRRQAVVRGSLILEGDTTNICEVVAKLGGQLEVISDTGGTTIKIFKKTCPLWSSSSSSSCPQTMNFACEFPSTFHHRDTEFPLPPSYTTNFPGVPTLMARCTYSLTFSIAKDRRLGILSKTKIISVPVEYRPQSSPPRGISLTPSFRCTVKNLPEEWHQSSFVMRPRSYSNLVSLHCQVFIPSVRVFGLGDTIPIHLQVSGPLASLRELISPASSDRIVRVYLTRMVTFEHQGKTTWRVVQTGEARTLLPLPPFVNFDRDCRRPACNQDESCVEVLDWAGEIRCDGEVAVGGFQAAGLTVKDFITLELTPAKPASSPLLVVQHAIPIRFVTESYIEPT
ncbi:hypothetical protein C8R43DRAFT_925684 [Mycena crocata]|nr:hypothetical protein C8R43DRAFT_925684 [Mycena crocata]